MYENNEKVYAYIHVKYDVKHANRAKYIHAYICAEWNKL